MRGRGLRSALLVAVGTVAVAAPVFTVLLLAGVFGDEEPIGAVAIPDATVPAPTPPPPTTPPTTDEAPATTPATTVAAVSTTVPTTTIVTTTIVTTSTEPAATAPPTTVAAVAVGDTARDFNGDGFSDVLWYTFGGGSDSFLWFGNAEVGAGSGRYGSVTERLPADLFPVTGDYNGDGFSDIFFLLPAGGSPVWYGNANVASGPGQFTTTVENPVGAFRPRSGDFDGDGFDDILWYFPSGAESFLWFGNADVAAASGGFRSTAESVAPGFDPFTGDFNGDGFSDIFFFVPAGGSSVWYGNANVASGPGQFTTTVENPVGAFRPRSGDFDGDGFDDILWYFPSGGESFLWFGNADVAAASGGFRSTTATAPPGLVPFTGDFNGDGFSDIFFFNPGGASPVWFGNAAVASAPGQFGVGSENPVGQFTPLN